MQVRSIKQMLSNRLQTYWSKLVRDVADNAQSFRVWRQDDLHTRKAGWDPAAAQDGLQREDILVQVLQKAPPQEQGDDKGS